MPTETSSFGPITLPLPAVGSQDAALTDPVLLGLLNFLGFLIGEALDTKLAEQRGPVDSSPVADSCPAANRYPFDLGDGFVHVAQPSLSAWQTSATTDPTMSTILYEAYQRDITVRYIFHPLSAPDGQLNRHGMMPAISKVMARAANRGRHLAYGYNGDPAGTALRSSLNLLKWGFLSSEGGTINTTPTTSANTQATRNVGYQSKGYPYLDSKFRVWERNERLAPSGDVMADGTFTQGYDDTLDGVARVLEIDNG